MRESSGVYPRGEMAAASEPVRLFFLHLFEQNRTSVQQRDHFFRHVNGFPQVAQTFSGFCNFRIKCKTDCEKVQSKIESHLIVVFLVLRLTLVFFVNCTFATSVPLKDLPCLVLEPFGPTHSCNRLPRLSCGLDVVDDAAGVIFSNDTTVSML